MADEEDTQYEDSRTLIMGVLLTGEQPAPICAAMQSIVDKAEAEGENVPGYVDLLDMASAMFQRPEQQ